MIFTVHPNSVYVNCTTACSSSTQDSYIADTSSSLMLRRHHDLNNLSVNLESGPSLLAGIRAKIIGNVSHHDRHGLRAEISVKHSVEMVKISNIGEVGSMVREISLVPSPISPDTSKVARISIADEMIEIPRQTVSVLRVFSVEQRGHMSVR